METKEEKLSCLKAELKSELINNILPYWMGKMVDVENGGFYGKVDGNDELNKKAEKGGILNARILWTFSSAYLSLKDPIYLTVATRAKDYILSHLLDKNYGGTYWSLNYDGTPKDTKKQIYSIAFTIYALSEYFKATSDLICLNRAIELFNTIEEHSFDHEKNGYLEAFSRRWLLLEDLRLSDKDANEKKTMNTHLHILEAYTNLYKVWKDQGLKIQLKNMIEIFLDKIINSRTFHLNLFFDEDWECKSDITSYGHDIEASWLLEEAAVALGERELLGKVREISKKIADAALEGLQEDGSMINERNNQTGEENRNRDWWPQAETVVGYMNAFQLTNNEVYLDKSLECWNFIKKNLVDHMAGEWFWGISEKGIINTKDDKAGFWKCPYHNGRMCMEIMRR